MYADIAHKVGWLQSIRSHKHPVSGDDDQREPQPDDYNARGCSERSNPPEECTRRPSCTFTPRIAIWNYWSLSERCFDEQITPSRTYSRMPFPTLFSVFLIIFGRLLSTTLCQHM